MPAATAVPTESAPAQGTKPGFGTQAPVQPKHDKAITGRQLSLKLDVATGTIRRARRKLNLVNSGTGYSPDEVKAITKLIKDEQKAKAASKEAKEKKAEEKASKAQVAAAAASASGEQPQG